MNSTLTSGRELVPLGSMMRFPLSHAATISDPGVPTQWQGHIGHDPGSFAHVQGQSGTKRDHWWVYTSVVEIYTMVKGGYTQIEVVYALFHIVQRSCHQEGTT